MSKYGGGECEVAVTALAHSSQLPGRGFVLRSVEKISAAAVEFLNHGAAHFESIPPSNGEQSFEAALDLGVALGGIQTWSEGRLRTVRQYTIVPCARTHSEFKKNEYRSEQSTVSLAVYNVRSI